MSVPNSRLLLSLTQTITQLPNSPCTSCPIQIFPALPTLRTLPWLPVIFRIRLEPFKSLTSDISPFAHPSHPSPFLVTLVTLGNPSSVSVFPPHSPYLFVYLSCHSSVTVHPNSAISEGPCSITPPPGSLSCFSQHHEMGPPSESPCSCIFHQFPMLFHS